MLTKTNFQMKKEVFRILAIIIFICFLFFGILGFWRFNFFDAIDINIHDTYFVFPPFYVFILIATILIFSIYMIRVILQKFKNVFSNSVLIVSTVLMILIFTITISTVNSIKATIEYPPLSGGEVEVNSNLNNVYNALLLIQTLLITLLVITGIKTGRNYQNKGF